MQINRLFEMIYILLEKGTVTAKEFSDRFEVSTRTVYRDVETLSAGKIPVYMRKGKGGGISLHPDFVLNKTVLTDQEKSEILSGVQALSAVTDAKSDSVVKKLSSLFGGDRADWVEIDFVSWENSEAERDTFAQLKAAILNKSVIAFDYRTPQGEVLTRFVEPLKLCFKGQSWYLYGFCRMRADYRFFKVRRLKNLRILTEYFDRRAPQIVLKQEVFHEKLVEITLKIDKKMAYRVFDAFERYRVLENGDFLAQITMPTGEWVYSYIATFGESAEVISPPWVRAEMKEKLTKNLEKYL